MALSKDSKAFFSYILLTIIGSACWVYAFAGVFGSGILNIPSSLLSEVIAFVAGAGCFVVLVLDIRADHILSRRKET